MLVALICRFLSSDHSRRLGRGMCSNQPANKAVSGLLAKRFLAAATDENGCSVRMLLVGDDEKLLESNKKSGLRPHYVYCFMEKRGFKGTLIIMTKFYHADNRDVHQYSQKDMLKKANNLRREIFRRLISLPPVIKNKFDELCKGLADRKCGRDSLFYLATQASNAIGGRARG